MVVENVMVEDEVVVVKEEWDVSFSLLGVVEDEKERDVPLSPLGVVEEEERDVPLSPIGVVVEEEQKQDVQKNFL